MKATEGTIENVVTLHALSEAQALDWLRAQPGGRIAASAAALGRQWGWHRQRVGRRLDAWAKAGIVKRRGDTVTFLKDVTNAAPIHVTKSVTKGVTRSVKDSVTKSVTADEMDHALVPANSKQFGGRSATFSQPNK